MLINSRKKFIGMLIGATFSAFILMQQPGTYQGVSDRLVAQIFAIKNTDLWVVDKNAVGFDDPTYFNSLVIYRIRSIPGVLSATQLYRFRAMMTHPQTSKTASWEVVGVDPITLLGLPKKMLAGDRQSIQQSNAIIIDGYALKQLETTANKTIHVGDKLIEGQRTWTVTGISKPLRTYAYEPKAYISTSHISSINSRPSFILVKIKPNADVKQVAQSIKNITGYDALTPTEFVTRVLKFFRTKTPIIIIFISVAILGFTIGLIIMWQIFNNFILTHIHQYGMLKMLGVSNALMIKMVFFQASIVGGLGYFLGLLLTILFGFIFHDTTIAFHLSWKIAMLGSLGTIIIVTLSSYFSILNVLRLDTIDLCRDLN